MTARLPAAALALAALAAALLGGCAGKPGEGEASVPPGPAPLDEEPSAGTGLPGTTSLLGEQWVFPSCRQHRFILKQDAAAAQKGLPPDHRAAGLAVADLTLRVSDCDALVQGNRSVQKPFRWAIVHQPLQPMGEDPNDLDWFPREIVVPDADVAARLAAFGLPAVPGTVAITHKDGTAEVEVVAASLRYTASFPDEPGGEEVDQTRRDLHRGGTDDRRFWMQLDLRRSLSVPVDRPALVAAEGGYLATALPSGSQPATVSLTEESVVATFGERRF